MHHLIFWNSFAELVALILLPGLAFYFLNKKTTSARGDSDIGASGSSTACRATNSGGSSSFPTKSDVIASRSLATSTDNCYDVFLSFRGLDTRKSFTDHLYHGLLDAGIHAFRDDDELSPGEEIGPELLAAIRNSKILIPVLSTNYGESRWCLDELARMMECKNNNGHIVLPIFYNVKPTDVRHQKGGFGDAFRRHSSKRTVDHLDKWKKALDEVSKLKGYEADGYEGELVKSIAQKVLSELKKEFELVMPENLVGIDGHVEKVMKFVDNNSIATLFIGIHGMGGIGKTTLAKAIYNKLSDQFEYRSFIGDIRESCERNGLVHVQNQLIYNILNKKDQVHHKDEGIMYISTKFKNKKVLILLDDVDDHNQLKALVGDHDWFSSGSKVFITTRNSNILANVGVHLKYEHEVMNKDDSMILFSRHAFRRISPPREFDYLAHDVITTTGGLPLSLEVLGSLLCGKKIPFWRGMVDKLKKVPPKEVQEKLRVSYEALDDGQKQIFLDIACFFIGTDRRIATYMWDTNGFFPGEGIDVLIFMSLIKCGDDHVLRMHDQLRDLGREIVREENQREPHYRSRLWDSKEARKVLQKNQGKNKIEAIDLSEDNWEDRLIKDEKCNIYTGEQFKNLTRLRFIRMNWAHLSGDFENSMEELKWLQWERCPQNFEVTKFHVKELVILELPGSTMVDEWKGWRYFMMAEKLKFIDLSNCQYLIDTSFLSAFKNLEILILQRCRSLRRIDSSIGDMKTLCRLDLRKCVGLRELPAEIGELKALEHLILEGTEALSALPDSVTSLQNLEVLDLSYSGIKELPKGIGTLRKLRKLYASSCSDEKVQWSGSEHRRKFTHRRGSFYRYKLQSLPDLPPNLTYLNITCQSRKLPSLSHLVHLKELRFWDCQSLECIELPSTLSKTLECSQLTDVEESELSQSLNTPFKLEYLEFTGCGSIKTLDVSEYIRLRALHVDKCGNLPEVRGIDKLIYLESLTITHCNSIKQLDLPESKSLTYLLIEDCLNLVEIQGIDRLEFLEHLNIFECTSLKRLLLVESKSLKYLKVRDCLNITEIQGIDRLEFLECLTIDRLTSLKRFLLPKSQSLKHLKVCDCLNITEIQGIDRSEFLECIIILQLTSLKSLFLPKSPSLKDLLCRRCEKLTDIQGLDGLKFLEELDISNCTSIKRVLLPKSGNLKKLDAQGCNKLVEIEGLNGLEFLEHLDISECTSIKRLEFSKSWRMRRLVAKGCENLAEIQGLDGLEILEHLDISKCTSIKRLEFPKSWRLRRLMAEGCKILAEIQGLNGLEFLEHLDISECTLIKRLEFPGSGRLERLVAKGCENLVEIQGLDRLECLEELCITRCTSFERVLLPKSRSLKILRADGCKKLVEIEGLDGLEFLELLDISECILIKRIEFPESGRLERLFVEGCENLVEIEGLDRLEFLIELCVTRCTSLERVLLPKSKSLKILHVAGCNKLAEIEGLDGLEFLELLNISECTLIKRLEFPESARLERLVAEGCVNLVEIQGLDTLEFLKELCITRCTSFERMLLPKSRSLKILRVDCCNKLAKIEGLDGLEFLKLLNISECTSIKRLKFPESGRLERLVAEGCENLIEIQGLDRLECLEELCITRCTSFERVLLPKSRSLKILRADGCKKLAEIEGLDGLEILELLDISECILIKRLEFPESGRLERLFVEGCENLVEIEGLDRLEFLRILSIFGCKSLKTIPELSRTQICREKPYALFKK